MFNMGIQTCSKLNPTRKTFNLFVHQRIECSIVHCSVTESEGQEFSLFRLTLLCLFDEYLKSAVKQLCLAWFFLKFSS